MKRILRYFLFGLGSILGTLFGMWLLRLLLRELEKRDTVEYDRERAELGGLHGDPTTDAPPPEKKEEVVRKSADHTTSY